jgi:hypothetical protein
MLKQTYEDLAGSSHRDQAPVFIERYSHGGMPSGYVSPQFWVEQAIPMLRKDTVNQARHCSFSIMLN